MAGSQRTRTSRSKRTEEALREQSRRFEAALHNMPHGLSMFNGEERSSSAIAATREMYRLPEKLAAPGHDARRAHGISREQRSRTAGSAIL